MASGVPRGWYPWHFDGVLGLDVKEPQRGQSEGLITEVHPTPFKVLGTELAAMLPIVNLIGLRRLGVVCRLILQLVVLSRLQPTCLS